VPGTWDDVVWGDISAWLRNDAWVEKQLLSEQSQDENTAKAIRLQEFTISQGQNKVAKVRDGFEGGIYSVDEAKRRIAEHQTAVAQAEKEVQRLKEGLRPHASSPADLAVMEQELKTLRESNLHEATFEEKLDIISKLGVKVYPSEDLKSMRIACQLNLSTIQSHNQGDKPDVVKSQADGECKSAIECGKVMFGSPLRIRTQNPSRGKHRWASR